MYYSPYAKVLVKTKTTPKNTIFAIFAIFELLYLNYHNIPTIENIVANTQLMLEQFGISIYWILVVLNPGEIFKDFWCAKTAKKWNLYGKMHCLAILARQESSSISSGFSTTNIQYMEIPSCSSMSWVLATKFSIGGMLWWLRYNSKIAKIVFFGVVLVFTKTFA